MPRPTIDQLLGLGDVLTTYQWNMIFVTLPTAKFGGKVPSSDQLNLRMVSTSCPNKDVSECAMNIRGIEWSQAGTLKYSASLDLAFYETPDNMVAQFIYAWRELATQTKTGAHALNSEVRCNILLQRLNRQDQPVWVYNLKGCYPTTNKHADSFAGDSGSPMSPTLSLKYAYFTEYAAQS